MKDIYIVLTYTGTVLSRVIKLYTRKRYSHVSIAIDTDINKMYSFGRLNAYNPFIGGFVEESIYHGTFKRFKNTDAIIYSMPVTDEQYEKIKKDIEYFLANKEKYRFNLIGLFLTVLNKKIYRKDCFYCAEFLDYIMKKEKIETNLPEVVKPDDFTKIPNIKFIYEGKLHDFYKEPKMLNESNN